jgi:hypothetical protein
MSKRNVKLILKILSDLDGAFKGLVEQKNVVFNSFVCKLGLFWHEWAILKRECLFAEQMTFDIYGLETTFSETKARTRLLFERTFLLQKQFFLTNPTEFSRFFLVGRDSF